MVKLTTITAANSAFIKRQPLTAVFVGATNGIGEFTVRELCKTHGQDGPGLRIIMVGRNEKAAQTIMEECKAVCSTTEFHFVKAGDISLLRSVDKACSEIRKVLESVKAPGIDILVQSQGRVQFEGRVGKSSLFLSLDSAYRLTSSRHDRRSRRVNVLALLLAHAIHHKPSSKLTLFFPAHRCKSHLHLCRRHGGARQFVPRRSVPKSTLLVRELWQTCRFHDDHAFRRLGHETPWQALLFSHLSWSGCSQRLRES
jgi:NAD(P)-dependent dehydrogenase (short-subunit alcohol dehydrogenase family)